ncbi:MAG TPA: hypothetical protein PKW69_00795 [Niabella sp.]|nr:hypothetical protein [Niabella sp.]
MRFNLSLIPDPSALVLPVHYQYPLSAAIYRIIAGAHAGYARFLHERGYHHPGSLRKFKLFCFSGLRTPFRLLEDCKMLKGIINFCGPALIVISTAIPQPLG